MPLPENHASAQSPGGERESRWIGGGFSLNARKAFNPLGCIAILGKEGGTGAALVRGM
jgi:hypothetical protein